MGIKKNLTCCRRRLSTRPTTTYLQLLLSLLFIIIYHYSLCLQVLLSPIFMMCILNIFINFNLLSYLTLYNFKFPRFPLFCPRVFFLWTTDDGGDDGDGRTDEREGRRLDGRWTHGTRARTHDDGRDEWTDEATMTKVHRTIENGNSSFVPPN